MTIAAPLIESGFICTAVLALVMDQNTKDVLLAGLPILSALGFGWLAYKGSQESKARVKTAELEAEAREKIAADVLAGNVKLEEVALKVNGMSSSLVAASVEAAELVGADKERMAQKAREAERAIGSKAVTDSAGVPGPIATEPAKEKNGAADKLRPAKPA